jgi:hypothetical protein
MNPKLKRYAERIAELIEESKQVAALERPSDYGTMAFPQNSRHLIYLETKEY